MPCTVREKDLDKVLSMFRNYLNEHEVFREARIDMVNEILNLEMPITILNKASPWARSSTH